jgi:hypothetical protein
MKRLSLIVAASLLAACAALGPPAITLSRADIAERAFVDRKELDTAQFFKGLQGIAISGPEVGFQLGAQRLEFTWTASLTDRPFGLPLSIRATMSGRPVLNAQRNGIDLEDARVEEVRLPAIPFINLDTRQMAKGGESLGTLPLLQFRPEELNRDGIVYAPTTLSLATFGLHVGLSPK